MGQGHFLKQNRKASWCSSESNVVEVYLFSGSVRVWSTVHFYILERTSNFLFFQALSFLIQNIKTERLLHTAQFLFFCQKEGPAHMGLPVYLH